MTRRTKSALVASHLALVAIGGLIGWAASRGGAASLGRVSAKLPDAWPAAATLSAGAQPSALWQSSEYARAWKAVRERKSTAAERVKLQRELLRKWAAVDLQAAIEAALGESWDSEDGQETALCGPLLDALGPELAKNPRVAWDWVRGRQFGLGTALVRQVWMEAVGAADPRFLASRLADLSWRDRGAALEICLHAVQDGAAAEADIFKLLATFPDDVVTAEELAKFARLPESPTDLAGMGAQISRLAEDDTRLAMVHAMQFGKALAAAPEADVAAQIDGLPEEFREEATWAAFQDTATAEGVLGLADLLIREEAWGKLERRETVVQLQKTAAAGGAGEVAEWALHLPVRAETIELFHRSVEPLLASDPTAAREWLGELPSGVWRDRAYAEFSQVSLNVRHDAKASKWALGQIADKDFRAEAEGWRAQWEKRRVGE